VWLRQTPLPCTANKCVDILVPNYWLPLSCHIETLNTILDKINGTSGPPLPHFNDAKMARFCSFAPSSLLWGGWGIIVPFYSVQDCRNICKFELNWNAFFYKLDNRPFAQSGHIVQNHTCWWSSCAVGLPKQRQVQVDWYELHCFGSSTVQLAHQHVWFCTMWPDRAKGLFLTGGMHVQIYLYMYVCIPFYFLTFWVIHEHLSTENSECIWLKIKQKHNIQN